MSGKEGKRWKGRRNLYSHSKKVSTNATNAAAAFDGAASKQLQPFEIGVKNINDVAQEFTHTLKSPSDDAEVC